MSTRLQANGVNVILDQWDLTLGSDLPRFMESGLTDADRVLTVCSGAYVKKSNDGIGGAGYEKMILTGELMKNLASDKVIPVIRANSNAHLVPTFLSSRLYIDFRNDGEYEPKYAELIRDIHGQKIQPKPPIGSNPFLSIPEPVTPVVAFSVERYSSPALSGRVTFDYSNNDGNFVVGAGDMKFETKWSGSSNDSIQAISDPPSIRTIAIARGATEISDISDASQYDTTSRIRRPFVGEIVVWQNTAGYYLTTKIEIVASRSHGKPDDEVVFLYVVAPNKSKSFAQI